MKKNSVILIIVMSFIFVFSVVIIFSLTSKNKYMLEENLSYIDVENNSESEFVFSGNDDCYKLISLIDFDILNMLNVEDTFKLTDEEKLDICINYIARNIENFSNITKNINKEFIYEENGTEYYSLGYIDKLDLINIANKFFNISNFDFSNYKFYDKQSDFVAIVPIINENVKYDNSEIIGMNMISDDMYSFKVHYDRSIQDKKNTFIVEYLLNKIDGKYFILGYNVINSDVQ